MPFIDRVAHGLADVGLEPCHERAIELEMKTALRLEEPAHILSISIRCSYRGAASDCIAVPIEGFHGISHHAAPRFGLAARV